VARELVDEDVSLSGVFGFAVFEVCGVLVLHCLLYPDIELGVRGLESLSGLTVW
jgi:hypothetical protein